MEKICFFKHSVQSVFSVLLENEGVEQSMEQSQYRYLLRGEYGLGGLRNKAPEQSHWSSRWKRKNITWKSMLCYTEARRRPCQELRFVATPPPRWAEGGGREQESTWTKQHKALNKAEQRENKVGSLGISVACSVCLSRCHSPSSCFVFASRCLIVSII